MFLISTVYIFPNQHSINIQYRCPTSAWLFNGLDGYTGALSRNIIWKPAFPVDWKHTRSEVIGQSSADRTRELIGQTRSLKHSSYLCGFRDVYKTTLELQVQVLYVTVSEGCRSSYTIHFVYTVSTQNAVMTNTGRTRALELKQLHHTV